MGLVWGIVIGVVVTLVVCAALAVKWLLGFMKWW